MLRKNLFDDEEDLTEEIKKNSEKGKNFYDNIIINAINKILKIVLIKSKKDLNKISNKQIKKKLQHFFYFLLFFVEVRFVYFEFN